MWQNVQCQFFFFHKFTPYPSWKLPLKRGLAPFKVHQSLPELPMDQCVHYFSSLIDTDQVSTNLEVTSCLNFLAHVAPFLDSFGPLWANFLILVLAETSCCHVLGEA